MSISNALAYQWRRFYWRHLAQLFQDKFTRAARKHANACGGFRG